MEKPFDIKNKKIFLKIVLGRDNQIKTLKSFSNTHFFPETFKFNVEILSIMV